MHKYLFENVKKEMQKTMLEQKMKEFEEYEDRKQRMKKWETNKVKQTKQAKRISKEKKRLDRKNEALRKENGNKAFRDWLKKSMEIKLKENKKNHMMKKEKRKEERQNKEKEQQKKDFNALAFKEWCQTKKHKKSEVPLTYDEHQYLIRQRRIEIYKKNPYHPRQSSQRRKSKNRTRRPRKGTFDNQNADPRSKPLKVTNLIHKT